MRLIRTRLGQCRRYVHATYLNRHSESSSVQAAAEEDEGGWPRRVVTGVQPTGGMHIGNYFGAVRRCVRLQDQGEDLMVFVADLHSLTTHQDPSRLQDKILEVTAYLLASGLDPSRTVLFVQSAVARHAELAWVLTCLATHARLAHLPQYKEKAATMREVPLGLLLYPVLQAADILLYRATHVPVGTDQLQHLQVASQLVRTFHHRYGRAFPTPRPLLSEGAEGVEGAGRIRSLRDPSRKMSKSEADAKSRVLLSDPDDLIAIKIRKAVTDFTPQVSYDPEGRPGVANLVRIHCLAEDKTPEEAVEEADGLTTAQYKGVVAAALARALRPVRAEAERLRARPALLRDVLRHGAVEARRRADETYAHVARLAGLTAGDGGAAAWARARALRAGGGGAEGGAAEEPSAPAAGPPSRAAGRPPA